MSELAEPLLVEVGRRSEKDAGGATGFVLIAAEPPQLHTFPLRSLTIAKAIERTGTWLASQSPGHMNQAQRTHSVGPSLQISQETPLA